MDASTRPPFPELFELGVAHFDARRFWEAHEAWEELWLAAGSDVATFLQGMIQMAAAYHHVQRGTLRGAVRLFDAALAKLEAFPHGYCGIDRTPLVLTARAHRQWAAELLDRSVGEPLPAESYPRLVRLPGGRVPPHDDW